jgi:hypothetical protein
MLASRDQDIYVKIGRTGNPTRRLSNYNAAYIGDRPPIYYRLLKVRDQVSEELHALTVFEGNRVVKTGCTNLSEVVLTTKELVDGYQPLCHSAIDVDLVSLPRVEEAYAAEPSVPEHIPKKTSGRPPKQEAGPAPAVGSREYVETDSDSESSPTHEATDAADADPDTSAFDPDNLEHPKPNKAGNIEITCNTLHITYATQFSSGLRGTVENLEKSLISRGYTLQKISAVEENKTVCQMIGTTHPRTHIAIQLDKATARRFKLFPRNFSIEGVTPDLIHIRLIKTDSQWNYIWNTYHHKENRPLQRIEGGKLQFAPKKEVQLSGKALAQAERAKKAEDAYRRFKLTNTATLEEILSKSSQGDKGGKYWFLDYDEATEICDHLHLSERAVVFHNNWVAKNVVQHLQKACNDHQPRLVILCLTLGRDSSSFSKQPESHDLEAICSLCEHIVSGSLCNQRAGPQDTPLPLWRPHVMVFAGFGPKIHRHNFDVENWSIILGGRDTSHMFVPSYHLDQWIAISHTLWPRPRVFATLDILGCLESVCHSPQGMIATVGDALELIFRIYSRPGRRKYWRRGYEARIHTVTTFYDSSSISSEMLYGRGLLDGSVRIPQDAKIRDYIGQNICLGNVIIETAKLMPAHVPISGYSSGGGAGHRYSSVKRGMGSLPPDSRQPRASRRHQQHRALHPTGSMLSIRQRTLFTPS